MPRIDSATLEPRSAWFRRRSAPLLHFRRALPALCLGALGVRADLPAHPYPWFYSGEATTRTGTTDRLREDPNRAGLLNADTNHGYIFYGDGESWQELNTDLPDIHITDILPEHDELAMASHGCGFWVLDNIAPLRHVQPGINERDLVLFDPAATYQSATGVVLSWWVGEDVQRASGATLGITDATGDVVRIFEPAEEGKDRLRWDLHTDPAATFPGMILWGGRTLAPAVLPGTYTVRLAVDGGVVETEVEVRRNPWIADVTANSGAIAIRDVKAQLDERIEASDNAPLGKAGDRLREAASAVVEDIYRVRNRSNHDPLRIPIRVTNRSVNRLSMSERGAGRPGSRMYAVFENGRLSGNGRLGGDPEVTLGLGWMVP